MAHPANRLISATVLVCGALLVFVAGAAADHVWSGSRARQEQAELAAAPQLRASYQHRVSHFERLKSRPEVVMLGDSITQWGEWNELIGPQVANRGVGGDTTGQLLARLDRSVPDSATTVVVMIGLNDLKVRDWRVDRSVDNVATILDRLKGRRVILQSVLLTSSAETNGRVRWLNRELSRLCDHRDDCEWLNLNPELAPEGALTGYFTADGRHLNGRGYEVWARTLKSVLDRP
ncbi:MAG: hypothetical protein JWR84_1459 [Caulobacter sp.]|nr:hypothetical protein [Caulobacter sp.]